MGRREYRVGPAAHYVGGGPRTVAERISLETEDGEYVSGAAGGERRAWNFPGREGELLFPKLERSACVQAVSASFFERIFGGAAAPMLAHFCETAPLSEAEIENLRAILHRRKKKG